MPTSALQRPQQPRDGVLQGSDRALLAPAKPGDLAGAPVDLALRLKDADPTKVLFTMPEAAEYLRYRGESASDSAYHWLRRHGLTKRRGTECLARMSEIDAVLDGGDGGLVKRALAHREKR